MRKIYVILCLGQVGLLQQVYAQSGSDFWGWSDVGVLITMPEKKVSFDAAYQFIANNNASDYFVQIGTASINYRFEKTHLQFTGTYVFGEINDFGWLHMPQLRLRQNFPGLKWHPFIRLTYDRLMIDTYAEIPALETNHRYRLQVGIAPPLNSNITLMATTEHFIRRREGWWAEQRSTLGLDFAITRGFHIRTFYFNRWLNFSESALRWNHAAIIGLRFFVSAPHKINKTNIN